MTLLMERYATQIAGVLSCFDRIVITGTLPGVCFAEGMAAYLRGHGVRLFDYPRFAEPLRDEVRQNAERIARENGLEIEFIRSAHAFRKEDRIRQVCHLDPTLVERICSPLFRHLSLFHRCYLRFPLCSAAPHPDPHVRAPGFT